MLNEYDDLEFEGQEDPETEVIVDVLQDKEKSIIFGLYSQLSTLENFYNRIQDHYKKVALLWLVSTFAALGFLFSQEEKVLPISPIYIALFVLCAAICGIILLWFLDIVIYQTYFFGVVIEMIKMESKYKWLPNTNIHFGKFQLDSKKWIIQGYFYIGCNIILLSISYMLCLFLCSYDLILSVITSFVYVFLIILMRYVMLRVERPKKFNPIRTQLKKFF